MARKPRYYLAGVPCHVIQRGNNRQACFFADADYAYYLECLTEASDRYGCDVHAYVLMTNHVHLLLTPTTTDGVSRTLQSVGRRYVQYINVSYGRSGTLWEGRHKASLIDSTAYLLSCYRYIELNPVRAGMVDRPEDYLWSSHAAHAYGRANALIRDHSIYEDLGRTTDERQRSYRELFQHALGDDDIRALRQAANLGLPLGREKFKRQLERQLMQRISYRPRGRPRKPADGDAADNEQRGLQS